MNRPYGFIEDSQMYPYLALDYGIQYMEWMRDWCERTAGQLESSELPPAPESA